jgi:hypothetical protein
MPLALHKPLDKIWQLKEDVNRLGEINPDLAGKDQGKVVVNRSSLCGKQRVSELN